MRVERRHWSSRSIWLAFCLLVLVAVGCSTAKKKAKTQPAAERVHQRGWIGGEYKLARKFLFWSREGYVAALPPGLAHSNRAGIFITGLGTNTPARAAGLCEGDLILACAHQPVTTLKAFHQLIDRVQPGTALPIVAWRNGHSFECNVPVGRETYKNWATLSIGLTLPNFSDFGHLDFWPNPGFDLGPLGYEPSPNDRKELASPEQVYYRSCHGDKHMATDEDWRAWLAIFTVTRYKQVLAQEAAPVPASLKPAAIDQPGS